MYMSVLSVCLLLQLKRYKALLWHAPRCVAWGGFSHKINPISKGIWLLKVRRWVKVEFLTTEVYLNIGVRVTGP